MPTKLDTIPPENLPVAERIRSGMLAFGYAHHGANKDFAAKYMGDAKKSPMVTDWRKGRYLPGPEILSRMAADWSTTFEWLRFGHGTAPSWFDGEEAGAIPLVSREQHGGDDVVALKIAVESLVAALLPKTEGAAKEFLAGVDAAARRLRFSTKRGTLGRLVDTAHEVQQQEAVVARAQRRAGPARRTKP